MSTKILIVANPSLQGGEALDISRYVAPAAKWPELKVILKPATSTLVIYSPGYEDRQVRFTGKKRFGWIQIAKPVLCIKAIRGPFEFNIQIRAARVANRSERERPA